MPDPQSRGATQCGGEITSVPVFPRDVYKKIEEARQALGDKAAAAPLSVIGLVDENHQLVRLLRIAVRTGAGMSRIRFSKNAINGHFIEDAFIYRVA